MDPAGTAGKIVESCSFSWERFFAFRSPAVLNLEFQDISRQQYRPVETCPAAPKSRSKSNWKQHTLSALYYTVRRKILMYRLTFILLACALLASCSSVPQRSVTDVLPSDAVIAAAEAPLSGTFRLQMRGTGRRDGRLYLNSEQDYRDQRCLTISIPDRVAADLAKALGGDPAVVLMGRTIRVSGVAQRVKILFIGQDGSISDRYYFQTHVLVSDAAQIELL